ncbi:MAG TPA: hypothetical protein VHB77_13560 [Planctomycetaceae bacterium]|nr:hypothetical protein [Planctomycetaceae bacterium]
MSEPQTTHSRRIAHSLWWAAAVGIVCLVAGVAWGWTCAKQRTAALEKLNNVKLRTPGYLPGWLSSQWPLWACEVLEVHGTTPEEWPALATLTEVETVSFVDADLTDAGLRSLRRMRRLQHLEFILGRGITDAGLAHLAGSPQLTELMLDQVNITDASLSMIGRLPKLERLRVYLSNVTGSGLPELAHAKHLRSLDIRIDEEPARCLESLDRLEALEELRLAGRGIRNASLSPLRLPPRVRSLDLSRAEVGDTQDPDLVELLAAVPGIDQIAVLNLSLNVISRETKARLCTRLGMTEKSPGLFERSP